LEFEKIAIEDPKVQEELKELQLPEGSKVVCDPWIYGLCSLSHAYRDLVDTN